MRWTPRIRRRAVRSARRRSSSPPRSPALPRCLPRPRLLSARSARWSCRSLGVSATVDPLEPGGAEEHRLRRAHRGPGRDHRALDGRPRTLPRPRLRREGRAVRPRVEGDPHAARPPGGGVPPGRPAAAALSRRCRSPATTSSPTCASRRRACPALDVSPSRVPLKVIDQILVTSVRTRALTLDEIRARGVDLSSADELPRLLVRDRPEARVAGRPDRDAGGVRPRGPRGAPAPRAAAGPPAQSAPPLAPTIVPMLLQPEEEAGPGAGPPPKLELPGGGGAFSIPALLVIPGDVGYLKQFFSAQLFVANGAPVGSGLVVRDVTGTINLPLGPDGVRGRDPDNCTDPKKPETCLNDDPLSLPDLVRDGEPVPHPETLPVAQVGPDGAPGTADDVGNAEAGRAGHGRLHDPRGQGGLPPHRRSTSAPSCWACPSARCGSRGRRTGASSSRTRSSSSPSWPPRSCARTRSSR